MAWYDEFVQQEPAPSGPTQSSLTYEMQGYDANGEMVYRGSDGNQYKGGDGPNGFVPYSGPGPSNGSGGTTGGTWDDSGYRNQVHDWYRSELGREGSEDEVSSWLRDHPDDPNAILSGLRASDEYKNRQTTPTGGSQPPPRTTVPGPNDWGGGLLEPFGGSFQPPPDQGIDSYIPEIPVFTPPTYTPPPAFEAPGFTPPAAFTEPTQAEAEADPGYQFGLMQGQKALEQSRAAQGTRLTGGTLKDILDYGRNAARQQYADVYGRKAKDYLTNYQTQYVDPYKMKYDAAVETYKTNYGTQYSDPYAHAYDAAVEAFKPKVTEYVTKAQLGQREHENKYQQAWDRFMFDYDKWKDQRDSVFDKSYKYLTT